MRQTTENDNWTDERLLGAFVGTGDETAFTRLVERYGGMVLRVCHNVLGQTQDAEDAAQAAFLALARKSSKLRASTSLGPWLYHVAYCVSVDARRSRNARQERERKAVEMYANTCPDGLAGEEMNLALTRELAGLPERYREPLILFHLEERSLEKTAAVLGCPVGTVGTRLARGRELLRKRLAVSGVVVALTEVGGMLSAEAGAAVLPATFVNATSKAAVLFAAKGAAAGEGLTSNAVALAKGWLKSMFYSKVKVAAVAIAAVGLLGTGIGFMVHRAPAEDEKAGAKFGLRAPSVKETETASYTYGRPSNAVTYGIAAPGKGAGSYSFFAARTNTNASGAPTGRGQTGTTGR
jgi:RNA polymerase sigma factor (sigma-70 family)